MKIEVIRHRSGEDFPILLDVNGLPVPAANEYVMGRRSLSVNTQKEDLYAIGMLYKWLNKNNIDLWRRIKSHQGFTEAEVLGGIVESLRAEQRKKKVQKISVGIETLNQRITIAQKFLSWCFDVYIGSLPRSDESYERIRENKIRVLSWLNRGYVQSPPKNKRKRKGATNKEALFLLEILAPDNEELIKNKVIRRRNYIVVSLMLYLGLRPGEVLSLKVEDIKIGAISSVEVVRRPLDPKDERAYRPRIKRNGRILPVIDQKFGYELDEYIVNCREELESKSDTVSDYLILNQTGNPLSQSSINELFNLIRKKFPSQVSNVLCPKSLRHRFSQDMERLMKESGVEEDRRRQALAYLRGDGSLKSQDEYIEEEIRKQAKESLIKYQSKYFMEDLPW